MLGTKRFKRIHSKSVDNAAGSTASTKSSKKSTASKGKKRGRKPGSETHPRRRGRKSSDGGDAQGDGDVADLWLTSEAIGSSSSLATSKRAVSWRNALADVGSNVSVSDLRKLIEAVWACAEPLKQGCDVALPVSWVGKMIPHRDVPAKQRGR